jgi:bacterioferritin-associated ferredoxin
MFVCVCHAVSDTEVKVAIDGGADSVAAVTRACKAGGDCGRCHDQIACMIGERTGTETSGLLTLRVRAA